MAEKSLDEKVAEALGWELKIYQLDIGGNHQYTVKGARAYWDKNFFTHFIANCKKYIEPEFTKIHSVNITKELFREMWSIWVKVDTNPDIIAKGHGATEEIAYCNALLDLKERGK